MRRNGMTRVVAFAAVSVVASCLYAQVGVGLRDNQYVHIGYTWKEQWNVTLEHSVFSQKFSTQYVRFLLSYKQQWSNWNIKAIPYYGTSYNGDFYNLGMAVDVHWHLLDGWGLTGVVNPHYDSALDYLTCFTAGTDIHLYKGITFLMQYSTVPEYRMKEERCKLGLRFAYGNLSVTPMLSVPTDGEGKHIRLLCSFDFSF